jgi:putative pyruvate formate lyase activating enzyme
VYRHQLHLGEERPLIPSYVIWLSGCNFSCSFCSDAFALKPPFPGQIFSPTSLADTVATAIDKLPKPPVTISFVGGEPAISLPFISETVLHLKKRLSDCPRFVLNSNGYITPAALSASMDFFDIFLFDLKFGSNACAEKLGAPDHYLEILHRNIDIITHKVDKELWVRHLLMPQHLNCCTQPTISYLSTLKEDVHVNIMSAFVSFTGNHRNLAPEEVDTALRLLVEAELKSPFWNGVPLREII